MRNMEQPISDKLLRSLNLLTPIAVHDHGASLRFAPIAVLSQRERHPFNLSQAQQFARSHNKPLIKWKLPLAGPAATWITKDEEASIYTHEKAGVYGFFVEGACVVNQNLHTSRSPVNGCEGFMFSLTLHHDDDGDDDDDDDDYNYSGNSKTLADYINEAHTKHAIYADGSVLEVEIPMPFSVNICPTISDHFLAFSTTAINSSKNKSACSQVISSLLCYKQSTPFLHSPFLYAQKNWLFLFASETPL